MKNQKEAIFQLVISFLGDKYDPKVAVRLSYSDRALIADQLFTLFKNGTLKQPTIKNKTIRGGFPANYTIQDHCRNMVQNWIRRDKRLNGGKKYTPKRNERPSNSTALADPQIQALFQLYKTLSDSNDEQDIKEHIINRVLDLNWKKRAA